MNRWPADPDRPVVALAGARHGDVLHAGLAQPVERGLHVEISGVAGADHHDHLALGLMVARRARYRPERRPAGAGPDQHDAALGLAEEGVAEGAAHAHPVAERDAPPE